MHTNPKKNLLVRTIALAALLLAGAGPALLADSNLTAIHPPGVGILANLSCEYRDNPLGIDVPKPRLSWVIGDVKSEISNPKLEIPRGQESEARDQRSGVRGQVQSAYQVLVATTPELLAKDQGDLWDSGKVESGQSNQIEYAGKALDSRRVCHWKVRVWLAHQGITGNKQAKTDNGQQTTDNSSDTQPSAWSTPAAWSMGLLKPEDWQAKWVKPPGSESSPWLRKEYSLAGKPGPATAFVNVKGYYELYVNGKKVGDDVLAPAVSNGRHRSFYNTHDISKYLREGPNCVGLWLGNGWIKAGARARVELDMLVGAAPVVVGTDATWTFMPSTYNEFAWKNANNCRENLDARRDIPDWSEVGCTSGSWQPVEEIAEPGGVASAQSCPPNRITKVIPAVACTARGANAWELDFGTNLTGWLRLRLPPMEAGKTLTIRFADKRFRNPDGDDTPAGRIKPDSAFKIDGVCYNVLNQMAQYTTSGKPGEQYCPKFNYFGFRYAIVEGMPAQPALGDAEALLIESDLAPVGSFACSNELFNRIHQLNLWTIRCLSLGGYMVDCPHRERLGYGDGQVSIDTQIMNRDAAAFYSKWATDWSDAQDPATGRFPHTAPFVINSWGGPGWGGLGSVLPWKNFVYYGDVGLLDKSYASMRRYAEYLDSQAEAGLLRGKAGKEQFLGDWVPPERGMETNNWPAKTACEIFNNCYRVYLWQMLERSARILGKSVEADDYKGKIDTARKLIHTTYFDAQRQIYGLDEQAYQVMPLLTGCVPDGLVASVQKNLAEIILEKNKGHLDTGMLGTYFLIQYLQEAGRDDLLYTIFNQQTYPGWGYMLAQGATTLLEQWNGYASQIHSCFASPGSWFYQGLAGIRPDASNPGFKHIIIKPAVVGDLTWVKCGYDSIHGRIASNWQRDGDKLTLDVTIPINTNATVYVPAKDAAGVTESGKPTAQASGVKFLRMDNATAVYAVGSGIYQFQAILPPR